MNYYDELIEKIESALDEGDELGAYSLIRNELSLPYIPADIEKRLRDIYEELKVSLKKDERPFDIDKISEYLKGDPEHQLIAASQLDSMNLREFKDTVSEFLLSDGHDNAKVLLIESMVRQDLTDEYRLIRGGVEYSFIPRYILLPEESDGYIGAKEILSDFFLHDPGYLKIGLELLYKECIMALPVNYIEEEGKLLADRIVRFICDSFSDEDKLNEYELYTAEH